jgi:hypothetical protein
MIEKRRQAAGAAAEAPAKADDGEPAADGEPEPE